MGGNMELVFERFEGRPSAVCRATHTIKGVKICGNKSTNNRTYPAAVLEAARDKYEGSPVFIDHPPKDKADRRFLKDYFGQLKNVQVLEGQLFGDLDYRPEHELAEFVVSSAESQSANFGMSHSAITEMVGTEVKNIVHVRSVDLVSKPATTKGLFESEDMMEIEALQAEIKALKARELVRTVLDSEKVAVTNELLESMSGLTEESMRAIAKLLPKSTPVSATKPTSVAVEEILEEVEEIFPVTDVKSFVSRVMG